MFLVLSMGFTSRLYAAKVAELPFTEDFEKGTLQGYWKAISTKTGRILVTSRRGPHSGEHHLTMDSAKSGVYSKNELILTIDLSGESEVVLSFYHKEFRDENYPMRETFTGSKKGDGVAVSPDGITWYKVQGLTKSDGISSDWKRFEVDLDAAIADAGIRYNDHFKIKFQQYDDFPINRDGFAFDDVVIEAALSGDPGGQDDLIPVEQELVGLINRERQALGLTALQINDALIASARKHSRDMAQTARVLGIACAKQATH